MTKRDTFQETYTLEREMMPAIEKWLLGTFQLKEIKPASKHDQKINDIDLYVTTKTDVQKLIEVKIRKKRYDDLLIESLSCEERKTLGWIYKSKADYLAYVFKIEENPVYGDVIDLHGLKIWWQKQGVQEGYPIIYGKTYTKHRSLLYKTRNRAVPLGHIPFHLFHAHRLYGYIKPLDKEAIDPSLLR